MSSPAPPSTASTVRVLFFAGARDVAGVAEVELEAEGAATVGALTAKIVARYPALSGYLRSIRIAVNGEYAQSDDDPVHPGDEVAVIPPVAGG